MSLLNKPEITCTASPRSTTTHDAVIGVLLGACYMVRDLIIVGVMCGEYTAYIRLIKGFTLSCKVRKEGDEFGQDKLLYLLTFVSAVLTEIVDVVTTRRFRRTVVAYRATKQREGLTVRLLGHYEKFARRTHGFAIAVLIVSHAIFLVASAKLPVAKWKVENFGLSDFSSPTKQLVRVYLVQGSRAVVILFCKKYLLTRVLLCGSVLGNLAISSLLITILTKVTPQEARAFLFLQLITVPQAIELTGEEARLEYWQVLREAPFDELGDKEDDEDQPTEENEISM